MICGVPIEDGKVKMCLLGQPCITISRGNARPTVAFDTIRRYFGIVGTRLPIFPILRMWMIRLSTVPGKITPQEVADKYIAAFREDVVSA